MLSGGQSISRISGSTNEGSQVEFSALMHQLLTEFQWSRGPQSISLGCPSKQIKYLWQSSWFARKIMLLGSLTSGHRFVSKSQSDSSRRTHLERDLEKKSSELQTRSTGTPSKHKKYRVHENGFGMRETPPEGQTISVGFWVVVVLDGVVLEVVVVATVVVVGAVGQFTLSGKSQYWFEGLNQKPSGQFWRKKSPSEHVK